MKKKISYSILLGMAIVLGIYLNGVDLTVRGGDLSKTYFIVMATMLLTFSYPYKK